MALDWNTAFWNPNNTTYGANYDWYDTPLVKENEPDQGAFLRFVTGQGRAGNSRQDQFAQSLYNRTQSGYDAAASSNPMLTYREYLNQLGPGFSDQLWNQLSAQDRGENPNQYGAGRVRIIGRG
jgi:hypothetical protein